MPAEAWTKLDHKTEQQSETEHQIYNRLAETEKNQDVAMLYSQPRPQPDSNAAMEP